MEKPTVLKQKFRLFDWQIGAVALILALWAWNYSGDSTSAWLLLPVLVFNLGNVFFRRVVLAKDRIIVYGMTIYGDSHRFERIVNYVIDESKKRFDVELMVQQKDRRNIEIFGSEVNIDWRRNSDRLGDRERIISFSIESEQLDVLLDYLHAQGAVLDEIAAMWKENDISSRVRLLTEKKDLPEAEAEDILREIEARAARLRKY